MQVLRWEVDVIASSQQLTLGTSIGVEVEGMALMLARCTDRFPTSNSRGKFPDVLSTFRSGCIVFFEGSSIVGYPLTNSSNFLSGFFDYCTRHLLKLKVK